MGMWIRFTINGAVYYGILQNSRLSESVMAMCPFEMQFSRSGNHEYYTALPKKADISGCSSTTEGHQNGLYCFEGWNALALVIEGCNTAPYPIYYIGDFDAEFSNVLKHSGRQVRILCETE